MKDVIAVFASLSAPYLIADGSLLYLYRNCSVGVSDLDFSLEHNWWKKNKDDLDERLIKAGFFKIQNFGYLFGLGYEEAWTKDEVKVDIFSSVMRGSFCVIGFWVDGTLYPCSMKMEKVGVAIWRNEISVRVPMPIDEALLSIYGKNFMFPIKHWNWKLYPFLTGYCSYEQQDWYQQSSRI